jgi:shikimate kinase
MPPAHAWAIAASAAEELSVLPRPIVAFVKSNREPRASSVHRTASPFAFILVGFMGAGKTSVGRILAKKLEWAFEDLDDRIECREGRTVPEIFQEEGEWAFRRCEHAALRELLSELRHRAKKVIALGGGAFVQKENLELIETAGLSTVFLDAPVEELWRRCNGSGQGAMNRPLLGDMESFCDLYDTRRPYYLKASFTQQTGGKATEQVAAEIIQSLGLEHKSRKRGAKN